MTRGEGGEGEKEENEEKEESDEIEGMEEKVLNEDIEMASAGGSLLSSPQ